jgi:KDO2-lipid IV(A) lauroyltransferase
MSDFREKSNPGQEYPEHRQGIVRMILACFHLVPLSWRIRVFCFLSLAYYHLSSRRRLTALLNLKNAFPEKKMEEIIPIAKGVYRNMAIVAAEFFDIPWLTKERIPEKIAVEGFENCVEALAKQRGLLMITAHFGNWELMASAFAVLFKPLVVLYRPMDNRLLDRIVLAVRSSTGNRPLRKKKAMRPMLRTLKSNGMVGLLIDQNWAWQEGVFVDFFGRPACTSDGVARLAMHMQTPVLPTFMIRQPGGKYRLVIGKSLELVDTGDEERDIFLNTQNYTRIIEDMIRKYPDHWFWVHQRWKIQPYLVE